MRYVARHVDDVCSRRRVIYGWTQQGTERLARDLNDGVVRAGLFDKVLAGNARRDCDAQWCVVDTQDGHR